jgi:signal peptidase I
MLRDYYACHEAERGDVVLYRYAGNDDPLIKIVRAVPEDTLELRATASGALIIINGEALATSSGEPYQLDARAAGLLRLYERDYGGRIPPNSYLILGNLVHGSLDSTRFGLVDKSSLIGKALQQ